MKSLSHLGGYMAVAALTATVAAKGQAQALEEVVVTAQKRTENLQDVPLAVTTLNADDLRELGIDDVSGVAMRTPGFSMGQFSAAQPLLFIRGIGSNERGAGGGEQSVAMFLDGVYINRAAGSAAEFFDIQSVEVLRGPQGTLWGKNSIGGAVNLRSRRPSDELTAAIEAEVGNFGVRSLRGLVSGPLGENMAGKLTLGRQERGTFVDSAVSPAGDTGDFERDSLRGQLLVRVSDNLEALVTADYAEQDGSGFGVNAQIVPNPPPAPAGVVNTFAGLQPPADFHSNFLEDPGRQLVKNGGLSLQLDWDLGGMNLTSITAFRKSESDLANNLIGTSLQVFPVLEFIAFTDEESEFFSQELQLSGDTDKLEWQAGLYYNNESVDRLEGGAFTLGPGAPALGFPPSIVGQTISDPFDQTADIESIAVFGQMTYALTDRLDMTIGARYSYETKDYRNQADPEAFLFASGSYDAQATENWSAPTGRFSLDYRLTEDTMVYASVASGFKSGGWGSLARTEVAARTPYDPEEAISYETGLKSEFFDNRIRLNAAAFFTQYTDLQIFATLDDGVCDVCPAITLNAGEAEIMGVELEGVAALTDSLSLDFTYAYLDTEYVTLDSDLLNAFEGNSLRNAPEHAYTAALRYNGRLPGGSRLSGHAEYIYQDDAFQRIQNIGLIPEYELVNLRLAWHSADDRWEVAGWVNNALDEEYLSHGYYTPSFGQLSYPGMPRSYGVTFSYSTY